jgi:hypothetical protein
MEEIKLKGSQFKDEKQNNSPPPLEYEKKTRGRPRKKKEDTKEQIKMIDPARFLEDIEAELEHEKNPEKKDNILSDKLSIIKKINQYKALFPDDTKSINTSNIDNLTPDKLKEKLKSIQGLVESRGSVNGTRSFFILGVNSLEKYDYVLKMKLQGLTMTVANNEELLKTCDEVSVKYLSVLSQTDPLLRLFLGLGSIILALDMKNKKNIMDNTEDDEKKQ